MSQSVYRISNEKSVGKYLVLDDGVQLQDLELVNGLGRRSVCGGLGVVQV